MKYFLSVLALSLTTMFAWAQPNSLGPAIGANFSSVSNLGDNNTKLSFGPTIGINYIYSNEQKLGLGIGLFFSQEGFALKNDLKDAKVQLNYLRVPLKGIYFFNTLAYRFRPKVFLGPSLGFLLSSYNKNDDDRVEIKDDRYQSFDLGVTGGLGFNYKLASRTWLNLDLAYTQGLLSINDVDDNINRLNQNIGATIGISFGF
ncbi:MAG: PorT family protein [Saprospiraceae bacterium]|nr:PorT family protein [Saprospiraceae bacterium]